MPTLNPDRPEGKRDILLYDKVKLAAIGRDILPISTQIASREQKLDIIKVFEQATDKIGPTNKLQILEELREFVLLIVDCYVAQGRQKNQVVKNLMLGEYQNPTPEQLEEFASYKKAGKMYWGKNAQQPILMMKLNHEVNWTPHTDDKWSKLLSLSDRKMSSEQTNFGTLSSGIGEFQYLIKYMQWDIVPKPTNT